MSFHCEFTSVPQNESFIIMSRDSPNHKMLFSSAFQCAKKYKNSPSVGVAVSLQPENTHLFFRMAFIKQRLLGNWWMSGMADATCLSLDHPNILVAWLRSSGKQTKSDDLFLRLLRFSGFFTPHPPTSHFHRKRCISGRAGGLRKNTHRGRTKRPAQSIGYGTGSRGQRENKTSMKLSK